MSESKVVPPNQYTSPEIWQWNTENGGTFANINGPTAGAAHEKILAVGKHPLQLYSLATPNGVKITIEFLQTHSCRHVIRWTEEIAHRPAAQRGRMVNRIWGDPSRSKRGI